MVGSDADSEMGSWIAINIKSLIIKSQDVLILFSELQAKIRNYERRQRLKSLPLSELISRQDSVRLFEFESLRQELKISLSDVQRFLSLGWIGVLEELHGKGLDMDILMDMDKLMGLWQDLYPFLLHLQQWILKLEKFLAFWEKVLYLLLFFSCVSEFPNSLRPPCTTMPWTIWPALVVLWGVCWMFYAPDDLDWEADAFEVENIDNQFPDFDYFLPELDYEAVQLGARHSDPLYLEQTPPQSTPISDVEFYAPTSMGSVPTSSLIKPQDTIALPITNDEIFSPTAIVSNATPYQATSATQGAANDRQLEASESRALPIRSLSSLSHQNPLDDAYSATTNGVRSEPPRNSKHSQTEKYLCHYPDCKHSREGSGFRRKDHLDQHLRGPHKQLSVTRLRAKPATVSSSHGPATTTQTLQALPQSKKRKRGGDGGPGTRSVDELTEELAEGRRLRLLAEQENGQLRQDNRQLRQELKKSKERMEKCEARLDKMMDLFGEQKSEELKRR